MAGDMALVIPTYRRPTVQKTWDRLPQRWRERTTFFVDQRDNDAMTARGVFKGATFVVVPQQVRTIAQKRALIISCCTGTKMLMLDDDLMFSERLDPDATGKVFLQQIKGERVGEWLDVLERQLDDYMHAGFGPRQNGQTHTVDWDYGGRAMYALGFHRDAYKELDLGPDRLGRIETREDFDYTLQLLCKGYPNAISRRCLVDQAYNAKGGASEERSVESSNADAQKLAELHPGLVRLTQKAYKASVPRVEVVVSWKKALEQGSAARASSQSTAD